MKAAGLGCLGFVFGAIVGGVIGIILGFVWINVFDTGDFQTSDLQTGDLEDYSSMLAFFTFMPMGAMIGGILGAAALAAVALRVEPAPPSPGTKNQPD